MSTHDNKKNLDNQIEYKDNEKNMLYKRDKENNTSFLFVPKIGIYHRG